VAKFAANLTNAFQRIIVPEVAAAKAPASRVEYLFPYDFEKAVSVNSPAHGLTQVCIIARWKLGVANVNRDLPDRVAEFRDGVGKP